MAKDTKKSKKRACGVIGYPLKHTLSPIMYNAAFKELGLEYKYVIFEITENALESTLNIIKSMNFRGVNITHPFKIKVIGYLDNYDDIVEEIGAVNTVINNNGKLIGYNTDAYGAAIVLKNHGIKLESYDKKILVLGAGGAARAVSVALAKLGNDIIIANRTLGTGEDLANSIKNISSSDVVEFAKINKIIDNVGIIINCTPVGMKDGPLGSPISKDLIKSDLTVFDIVYSPKETPLLKAAKESGATVIYGYEMLVYQGVKTFELFTGKKAPIEVMKKVVLSELDSN